MDLRLIAKDFEKGLNNGDYSYLKDILIAINGLNPDKAAIEQSRLGSQISNLKKSCLQADSSLIQQDVVKLCKSILTKWQLIIATGQSSSSSAAKLTLRLKPQHAPTFDASSLNEARFKVFVLIDFLFLIFLNVKFFRYSNSFLILLD